MSMDFTKYLEESGIIHETSAPQTPQQNGVAEHMNQTLLGGARAMLHHAGMTLGFWSEAIHVAAHVLNRAPRAGLDWKTPYELVFGCKPEVSHLRVFGCRAWTFDDQARKWESRSKPMIFVGYEITSKAYRLWDPKIRKIIVSTNIVFDESALSGNWTCRNYVFLQTLYFLMFFAISFYVSLTNLFSTILFPYLLITRDTQDEGEARFRFY